MAVFVVDNGEQYSSHEILFVETDVVKEHVDEIAKIYNSSAKVVATAESFTWFEGGYMPLFVLANPIVCFRKKFPGAFYGKIRSDYLSNIDLLKVVAEEADRRGTWNQSRGHGVYSDTVSDAVATASRNGVLAAIATNGQTNKEWIWPTVVDAEATTDTADTIVRRVR